MQTTLGRWILEKMRIYHPFTGVTNNQSESFNAILKRLQKWREVPLDVILLSLYHLQAFFHNEIQRGLAGKSFCSILCILVMNPMLGLGNYHLLPEFSALERPCDEIDIIKCHPLKEIVDHIRDEIQSKEKASASKTGRFGLIKRLFS